jgi:hypothetical protein
MDNREERIHRSLEFFADVLNVESRETPGGLRTLGAHSLGFLTELAYQEDNSESLYETEWVRGISGPVSPDLKRLTEEFGEMETRPKNFMDEYEVLTDYEPPEGVGGEDLEEYLDTALNQLLEADVIKPRSGGIIFKDRTPVMEQQEVNQYISEICSEYRETDVMETVNLPY